MYDVVISGAGPSGSVCARTLAEAGYSVVLIEKDTSWRKPCGGALHPKVFELCPELKKLNLLELKQIIMHSADNHTLKYRSSFMENGAVADRLIFDNFLREKCVEAGAELQDKTISYDFTKRTDTKIGIKTKSVSETKEFHGKVAVISDGMSSKLAPKSGIRLKWKIDQLAMGKCSIIKGSHDLDENTAYVFFRPYRGYGWIFPIDTKRFNIGVYTFGEDNLKRNLDETYHEFLRDPNIQQYIPKSNFETIWSSTYPFPIEGVLQKSLNDDNIMIVGDAAGFISPISGEGIQSSMISGNIAAKTAIKALEEGDFSKNSLNYYKRHSEVKALIKEFKLKRSMIDFFYENKGANFNRLVALTEKDPEFKKQVIDLFISEEMQIPDKEFFERIK